MFAFIYNFLFIFAEAAKVDPNTGWGKFLQFWNTYLNYPGFEAWKFLNLAIFVYIIYRLLKRPLSSAFIARREAIRADIIKAEEKRQAALAQLTTTEAKLASLENDKTQAIREAEAEAKAERERIEREAALEANRLKSQASNEIERKSQQVRAELRRFSAEESIRLAEEKLKSQMTADTDARLVKASLQSIGGLN